MLIMRISITIVLIFIGSIRASEWWNGWSPTDNNDRYQRAKLPVSLPQTKKQFKQLWYTKLDGPIQSTPTVYNDHVYVPSIGGTFYCISARSGNIIWQRNLTALVNDGLTYRSRTSPLIHNGMVILGLLHSTIFTGAPGDGAHVLALKLSTGNVVWQRRVSTHPAALITATPQLANGRLFVGISSIEEAFAEKPAYQCCTFQGSVVALDANTGQLLWETKMIPDNDGLTTGYSGASVWGSQFPVDHKRQQIYIGTGNYYKVPAAVEQCVNATANLRVFSDPCHEPNTYGESILALDMQTGLIRWSQYLGPVDAWTAACVFSDPHSNPNCPPNYGPDADFGQAPILKLNMKYKFGGKHRDQIFVGQKSGIAYGFDAETGRIIWSTKVAPGSFSGGMLFGSAADDQNIYVGNNNGYQINYTLPDGTVTNKASWSALDLVTGQIKWTTVDPTTNVASTSAGLPLTVWDRLVLVQGGSSRSTSGLSSKGCVYGLNKANGKVLYEKCIRNTVIGSGLSVAKNTIYFGTGYLSGAGRPHGLMALQLP